MRIQVLRPLQAAALCCLQFRTSDPEELAMPAVDPDARLFFEALSQDCLSAPQHVRWLIEQGVELSPGASHLGDQLFADQAYEFDELLVAAALWVASGVCAHLAGATWISDQGRPVMLVAASDEGGDISDDYLLDFQSVFEAVRRRHRSGEDSQH